jgi:protoheme IX farnesyltransferase
MITLIHTSRAYYELTKPGIIYGNALSALAGFFFASRAGEIDWKLLLAMVFGLSFIIASSCVLNNIYDRDIDSKMERTKTRATVTGAISPTNAALFAIVLVVAGAALLYFFTNLLTLRVALLGFFFYVCLYTPLKKRSPTALFVGAVAGAVPVVVGYVAVASALDFYAWILFAFMYAWQIPHFLAISVYKYNDYFAAGIPLYVRREPSIRAKKRAKTIFLYSLVILLLFCAALMLSRFYLH